MTACIFIALKYLLKLVKFLLAGLVHIREAKEDEATMQSEAYLRDVQREIANVHLCLPFLEF